MTFQKPSTPASSTATYESRVLDDAQRMYREAETFYARTLIIAACMLVVGAIAGYAGHHFAHEWRSAHERDALVPAMITASHEVQQHWHSKPGAHAYSVRTYSGNAEGCPLCHEDHVEPHERCTYCMRTNYTLHDADGDGDTDDEDVTPCLPSMIHASCLRNVRLHRETAHDYCEHYTRSEQDRIDCRARRVARGYAGMP